MKSRRIPWKRRLVHLALATSLFALSTHCSNRVPHQGRFPFSQLEKAPTPKDSAAESMTLVLKHEDPETRPDASQLEKIRSGDVIAFTMSHRTAWQHLKRGRIQKIPYELFRYGHLALVVPDEHGDPRLLQVAMKQAVTAVDGLDYLEDKTWEVYRPPSVDVARLRDFAVQATENASDPKRAYDYGSVSGWKNAPWQPEQAHEIGSRFSCTTLVIAGLHYAGFELDAVHRGGRFDVVTPRQVIESRGLPRPDQSTIRSRTSGPGSAQ